MRTSSRFLAVIVVVVGVSGFGCDGSDGAEGPPALEAYFAPQPYANAACNAVDQRLAGERHMRLYVNGGGSVKPIAQGLANYYHRHSLSFFTDQQPQATTMTYALDTDEDALMVALREQFPGVDFEDEAALEADPELLARLYAAAGNFGFRPVIEFLKAHSDGGAAVTNLIVVPQVENPDGTDDDPDHTTAGIAVSPALLAEFARETSPEAQAWLGIDLPANFSPIMVMGNDVLKRVSGIKPELDDLITAHEFGHTGGLVHTMVERNLMYPSTGPINDCTDGLDDQQLAIMSASYGLGPGAAPLASRVSALSGSDPSQRDLARPVSSFPRERRRSLLKGERGSLRSFLQWMLHAPDRG